MIAISKPKLSLNWMLMLMILPLVLLGTASLAVADDIYWIGESGSWEDPNNWSPAGPPSSHWDWVVLQSSDAINRTVYYDGIMEDGPTAISIVNTGTGTMTLSISGGTLVAGLSPHDQIQVGFLGGGELGRGTVNQSGGYVGFPSVYIENGGTYNLSGGRLNTAVVINLGIINYSGGELDSSFFDFPEAAHGSLSNGGTLNLFGPGTRTIEGNIFNSGTFKTTNTTAVYTGTFTNNGAYISDPATQHFNDLVIGQTGYIKGGLLDFFYVGGDFKNQSTMNTFWNTSLAYLGFVDGADSLHDFYLAGVDYGASLSGYSDNFSWGFLDLRGDFLNLYDGNNIAGGALYAGDIWGLQISDHFITNITGMDGLNIYYLADLWGNSYLRGLTYDLAGGGHLIPIGLASVPEPATMLLLGCGLIGLVGLRRKFKK
jgi:hypothetical protein